MFPEKVNHRNADGYKPNAVPRALKVISCIKEATLSMDNLNEGKGQVTFRNIAPIFYVPDRKLVLDYYKRLGFWCDYDMGFVEWNGIGFIVHERKTIPATPNNDGNGEGGGIDAFGMVSDIDMLFEEFKSKDAVFLYELKTNEYNMREFAIKDPAGFTIGFGQ